MGRTLSAALAIAVAVGLIGPTASARAVARGALVAASPSVTCNFHGHLARSASGIARIDGQIEPHAHTTACSLAANGPRKGALSGLSSTHAVPPLCGLRKSQSLPDLGGGRFVWSPRTRFPSTTGVALTDGLLSVVNVGAGMFLEIDYPQGTVAGGSFKTTTGISFTAVSRFDTDKLMADCAKGPVSSVNINGTFTFR